MACSRQHYFPKELFTGPGHTETVTHIRVRMFPGWFPNFWFILNYNCFRAAPNACSLFHCDHHRWRHLQNWDLGKCSKGEPQLIVNHIHPDFLQINIREPKTLSKIHIVWLSNAGTFQCSEYEKNSVSGISVRHPTVWYCAGQKIIFILILMLPNLWVGSNPESKWWMIASTKLEILFLLRHVPRLTQLGKLSSYSTNCCVIRMGMLLKSKAYVHSGNR